jgi:hypothetical protein
MSRDQVRPNTGRYATEQEALDAVVARLVEALDPQAIWLFGSRARPSLPLAGRVAFRAAKGRVGLVENEVLRSEPPPSVTASLRHLPRKGEGWALGSKSRTNVSSRARRSAQRCDADTGPHSGTATLTSNRSRVCAAALHAAARTG